MKKAFVYLDNPSPILDSAFDDLCQIICQILAENIQTDASHLKCDVPAVDNSRLICKRHELEIFFSVVRYLSSSLFYVRKI